MLPETEWSGALAHSDHGLVTIATALLPRVLENTHLETQSWFGTWSIRSATNASTAPLPDGCDGMRFEIHRRLTADCIFHSTSLGHAAARHRDMRFETQQ